MLKRLLKRTSAYKDLNGKNHYDISQDKSEECFNDVVEANRILFKLNDNKNINEYITYIIKHMQYAIYDNIGIFGFDYYKHDKKIIIEFQLGILTTKSINNAIYKLTEKLDYYSFSIKQTKQIINEFEQKINDNYYFLTVIAFDNLDKSDKVLLYKTFPKDYSIPQIKNWCVQNSNQYLI